MKIIVEVLGFDENALAAVSTITNIIVIKNAFADTSIVHPFMCVITRTIVQQNAVIVALYL